MSARHFRAASLMIISATFTACSESPNAVEDSGSDVLIADATTDTATADVANDTGPTPDADVTDADVMDADVMDADVMDADVTDASVDCSALPARDCVGTSAYCGELVQFSPSSNDDYDDYPFVGETAGNLIHSYGRRDLVMLVTYATAKVACLTRTMAPTFHPLGIGDMSQSNGAIPGTSVNTPFYPSGTHESGLDIDVAYYQTGTVDNHLRAVCPHISGGNDAYHCTDAPTSLDVRRTALFLGALSESSRLRLIAVDGRIGPVLEAEIDDLCTAGTLTPTVCTRLGMRIGYETSDMGLGLYYFNHDRIHIAITALPL